MEITNHGIKIVGIFDEIEEINNILALHDAKKFAEMCMSRPSDEPVFSFNDENCVSFPALKVSSPPCGPLDQRDSIIIESNDLKSDLQNCSEYMQSFTSLSSDEDFDGHVSNPQRHKAAGSITPEKPNNITEKNDFPDLVKIKIKSGKYLDTVSPSSTILIFGRKKGLNDCNESLIRSKSRLQTYHDSRSFLANMSSKICKKTFHTSHIENQLAEDGRHLHELADLVERRSIKFREGKNVLSLNSHPPYGMIDPGNRSQASKIRDKQTQQSFLSQSSKTSNEMIAFQLEEIQRVETEANMLNRTRKPASAKPRASDGLIARKTAQKRAGPKPREIHPPEAEDPAVAVAGAVHSSRAAAGARPALPAGHAKSPVSPGGDRSAAVRPPRPQRSVPWVFSWSSGCLGGDRPSENDGEGSRSCGVAALGHAILRGMLGSGGGSILKAAPYLGAS